MLTSTVSKKGLTTVPSKIRELLGIKPGDRLEWRIIKRDDKILIEVEAGKNPYEFLKGRRNDPRGVYEKVEHLADALLISEVKPCANH